MYKTHSALIHTRVHAHTCLHHHLPSAVFLWGSEKDHLAGQSSQHALRWKGCFLARFGAGVSEQRIMEEHGEVETERSHLKPLMCAGFRTPICVCGLESLRGMECYRASQFPLPCLFLISAVLPLSSSSSPAHLVLPCHLHMPWQCQELLPPGSWGTLLPAHPSWGLWSGGFASRTPAALNCRWASDSEPPHLHPGLARPLARQR